MDFFQIVEVSTIIVTFIMMLSGIPPCISMYNSKETKNVPLAFFLVCLMNSMIGLYYGLLIDNSVLKVINMTGLGLFAVYIIIYIMVSKDKGSPATKLTSILAIFVSLIAYLVYVIEDHHQVVSTLGKLMLVWGMIVVVTPVLEIIEVVKQKDSSGVSLSLLFGGLMCSIAWFLYGYLLKDVNIYGPNIVGNVVNLTRLGVLVTYRGGSKKKVA